MTRLLLVVVAVAAVRGAAGQGDAPLVSAVAEAQANAVAAFFNYVVTLFNSADLPNVAAALVKPNVPTNVTVDPGTSVSGASEAVVTAVANNFVFPGLAHMSDYIYPMVRGCRVLAVEGPTVCAAARCGHAGQRDDG